MAENAETDFDSIVIASVRTNLLHPGVVEMTGVTIRREASVGDKQRTTDEHVFQAQGDQRTVGQVARAVDRAIEIEGFHLYKSLPQRSSGTLRLPTHLIKLSQSTRRSIPI